MLLLTLLFLPVSTLAAQDGHPPYTELSHSYFESGNVFSLTHRSPWFYKAGDDTSWANPDFIREEFIHENWEETTYLDYLIYLEPHGVRRFSADGNIWLFKEFRIDSSLFGEVFAITGKINGALEFYVNGEKAGSAGRVGLSAEEEVTRGFFLPIEFEWGYTEQQFVAIRYSYHTMKELGPEVIVLGLELELAPEDIIEQHFEDRAAERALNIAAEGFATGASAVLGLLLLFLYIMYPKQRKNLIASILFLVIGFSSAGIIYYTIWEQPQDLIKALLINGIGLSLSAFINVWFAYKLVSKKINWLFRVFALLAVIVSAFAIYTPMITQTFALLFWVASMIYVLALFLRARIRRGMKDLDIILVGFGVYFVALITIFFLFVFGYIPRSMFKWLTVASLLVPVSYSFYLAREVARTNDLLSQKLEENKRLADEKLRQEQENKRLIESRKEELEQEVKTRTAELADAYRNLKKSHEDLKNTQQQLIQQEKMASLGLLTAGIAHEIKNPLNFVNNFSEVSRELIDELREELEKVKNNSGTDAANAIISDILDDIEANIATINKHGRRADSIVHGMLLHSRGKSGEKMPTDINKLLDEYADLAFHGLRAKDPSFNATIEKNLDPEIGSLNVVPQEISRAFLNIINNGLQATHEYFKTEGVNELITIGIFTKKLNNHIEIRIKDNGPGIPEKIRKKIFDPFFTTKSAGEGTGLGLSMTYDIIKSHNGTIHVETEEKKGTEFVITLPVDSN